MNVTKLKTCILFGLTSFFIGCHSILSVREVFDKKSPYESYVNSLEKAGLRNSELTQRWIKAGEQALSDSIVISLPFSESGFFEASYPRAYAYRFTVRSGQELRIKADSKQATTAQLFLDLFVLEKNDWEAISAADSSLELVYEATSDKLFMLRLQPEVLADMHFSLMIFVKPVLRNPVSGAVNRSIGSFYGHVRDGGKRRHEGIDIFAPRGTPVIAPTDGIVSSTGTNNLGGKVVWQYDVKRGQTYYFAHLDSQLVRMGQAVKQGDTLGLVGNTGNAAFTAPHLHFGIYKNGSRDPLQYVYTTKEARPVSPDTSFRSVVRKVSVKKAKLLSAPDAEAAVLDEPKMDTYLQLLSQSGSYYRVVLADGMQAYINKSHTVSLGKGKALVLTSPDTLWSDRGSQVPKAILPVGAHVSVLATSAGYHYIKTPNDLTGWLRR